jgi:PhnB protein
MSNKNQPTLNPYLTFGGNCREAMEFYQSVLNGDLEINPFEGAPMEIPDGYENKVMHASLKFGDAVLMASDSMPGQPVEHGNDAHLSINLQDVREGERIFKGLSAGGQVTMEFQDTFWGARFGSFIDRYGVSWMVNCDRQQTE